MAGNTRNPVVFSFGQQVGFADLEQLPKGRIGRARLTSDVEGIGFDEVTIFTISGVNVPSSKEVEVFADLSLQQDGDGSLKCVAGMRVYQGSTIIGSRRTDVKHWSQLTVTANANQGAGVFDFHVALFVPDGDVSCSVRGSSVGPGIFNVDVVSPQF